MSPAESDTRMPFVSWPAALARACHPARLAVCGAGLAATLLTCEVALAVFTGAPRGLAGWWQDPAEGLRQLGGALFGNGSGTAVFRCLVLAVPLFMVWGLAGGWVARAELLRHRGSDEPVQTSATRLVLGRASSLCALVLMPLFLVCCLLVPGLIAGVINRVPGVGAVLVAVLLPIALVSSLMAMVVAVGLLGYPLMPTAVAAEGEEALNGLARGYSYFYQRPLHFAWWLGISLALSGLPAAAVFWLQGGQAGTGWPVWAAAVLSLSCFWTLQALVYLKLRRSVDQVGEDEVWDDPLGEKDTHAPTRPAARGAASHGTGERPGKQAGASGAGATYQPSPTKAPEGEESPGSGPAPEPVVPKRREVSFRDTVGGRRAGSLSTLLVLVVGMLWAALVLGGACLAVWHVAGPPNQEMTAAGVRQAVLDLAARNPLALVGIALAAVLVGAVGFAGPARMAARRTAVGLVYERNLPVVAAWSFTRKTRWSKPGSTLLVTAGGELFLVTLFLVPLVVQGTSPWQEVVSLGGLGVLFLGAGALGLGAVAVEGTRPGEAPSGAIESYLHNGGQTLASAASNLVVGPLRCLIVAGLAGLTWGLTCESLAWWGGENVRWVRWGLDGSLRPASEGGPYEAASLLAGLWFFLLCGLVLAYPVSYVLSWGVACYLRARQQAQDLPPSEFDLSEEEVRALRAAQRGGASKLLARLGRKDAGPEKTKSPDAAPPPPDDPGGPNAGPY